MTVASLVRLMKRITASSKPTSIATVRLKITVSTKVTNITMKSDFGACAIQRNDRQPDML